MKQNREPQILNRQFGEDLASAFPDGIPDDMSLKELQDALTSDELDSSQKRKVNQVITGLKRAGIENVQDLRSKNKSKLANDTYGLGPSAADFLEGLVDGE